MCRSPWKRSTWLFTPCFRKTPPLLQLTEKRNAAPLVRRSQPSSHEYEIDANSRSRTLSTPFTTSIAGEKTGLPYNIVMQAFIRRNQVQRIFRRLPVGSTQNLFYFNELPGNVKQGVTKLALHKLREAEKRHAVGTGRTSQVSAELNGYASINERNKHTISLMELHPPKLFTSRAVKHARASVVTGGDETCTTTSVDEEAALLIPALHKTFASLGVEIHTIGRDPSGKVRSRTLNVTTTSTATRVDLLTVPQLYILFVPVERPPSETPGDDTVVDNTQSPIDGFPSSLLSFNEDINELVLRSPVGSDAVRRNPHVSLAATYGVTPARAFLAAQLASSLEPGRTDFHESQPQEKYWYGYRLFYLMPVIQKAGGANPSVMLRDFASLYPSSFRSFHVDIPVIHGAKRSFPSGSSEAQRNHIKTKRLRVTQEAHLWATQVVDDPINPLPSDVANDIPTERRRMLDLQHLLTQYEEGLILQLQLMRSGGECSGAVSNKGNDKRRASPVSPPSTVLTKSEHRSSCAASGLGAFRNEHISFVGVEAVLPNMDAEPVFCPKAQLAPLFWRALYRSSHPYAAGSAEVYMVSPLATSIECLAEARERVLVPFLSQPRKLPFSYFHSEKIEVCAEAWVSEEPSFIPLLWTPMELEVVAGWKQHFHLFENRFGPFDDMLSSDLILSIGRGPSSKSSPLGRTYDRRTPLLLVFDTTFVEKVLLPAMRDYFNKTFVRGKGGVLRRRHELHTSGRTPSSSDEEAAVAVAVHDRRLRAWCKWELSQAADTAQRMGSSRLDMSLPSSRRLRIPETSRSFLKSFCFPSTQSQRAQSSHKHLEAVEDACMRVGIIPIQEFLVSLNFPSVRHSEAQNIFTNEDLFQCIKYFLSYEKHFEVFSGVGTTVAFRLP